MGRGDLGPKHGQFQLDYLRVLLIRYSGHDPSLPYSGGAPLTSVELFPVYTSVCEENQALCSLIYGSEGLDEFSNHGLEMVSHRCRLAWLFQEKEPSVFVCRGMSIRFCLPEHNDNAGVCLDLSSVQPPNSLNLPAALKHVFKADK